MKSAQQWFDEYAVSHQNKINKRIHWICVPAIFFSIIGLLVAIPHAGLSLLFPPALAPYANFGSLVIFLGLLFYLVLSARLFIGMLVFSVFVLWANVAIASLVLFPHWLFSLTIFVLAWIGQFIGHHIEGAKPSFFKDLQFLLIGPAWLMGFVYKGVGWRY